MRSPCRERKDTKINQQQMKETDAKRTGNNEEQGKKERKTNRKSKEKKGGKGNLSSCRLNRSAPSVFYSLSLLLSAAKIFIHIYVYI